MQFQDNQGVQFNGMWYASILVEEEQQQLTTKSFDDIKAAAKMSVIAVPLRYLIGETDEKSDKFCVISNWWKVRNRLGEYTLPQLDKLMYREPTFDDEVEKNPYAI